MIYVSGARNNSLIRRLCRTLAQNGGAAFFNGNLLTLQPDSHGFIEHTVVDAGSLRIDGVKSGIAVFNRPVSVEKIPFLSSDTVKYIAEENDGTALEYLNRNGCEAIICGMSSKATVTISSLTDDSAVVTVQREIVTPVSNTVLPCDIPVTLSEPSDGVQIMQIATVLLLTGGIPQKHMII